MPHYSVTLVKDRANPNNAAACRALTGDLKDALAGQGIVLWGAFTPLFGLATNELYAVTVADAPHDIGGALAPADLDVVQTVNFIPTVRPTEHAPRGAEGLYVFRWFDVHNRDVEQIAALSREAWVTFEGDFDTRVQALFAEPGRSAERGKMLLITWYTGFSVWEASRRPSPEARENFMRRARLTLEAKPIATRLFLPG